MAQFPVNINLPLILRLQLSEKQKAPLLLARTLLNSATRKGSSGGIDLRDAYLAERKSADPMYSLNCLHQIRTLLTSSGSCVFKR